MKSAANRLIPLQNLAVGQSALVDRVDGQADHVHRLHEFGLLDGTQVEMFRTGNPCIIRLAGGKICLRSDDLLRVMVKPMVSA